jgi:solute:Na+ symporter, SSS family
MVLTFIDISIIFLFLGVSLWIGTLFAKTGGENTQNFFLGGRNLPWWLAGTSMVATTFAADTPLLVTELVAKNGISGNWVWWNGIFGGMVATFFFAHLWRRAEIITDLELIELRYSGTEAKFLRGFKAIYLGIFLNAVIIAWVNVALGALIKVFFGVSDNEVLLYIGVAMVFVAFYSGLSGLLGVAMTDFLQFIVAMGGTIILAFVVVGSEKVGGIAGLQKNIPAEMFNFLPNLNFNNIENVSKVFSISLGTFLAYIGFQWWASWYPGAEPGGGGYIAQRMMSVKTEGDAVKATLLFQMAHYVLRPLPWILVALASIMLYPELPEADKKLGYVRAMKDFLPEGLRGLLLASFLAAYMSTISTQLNWGASYLINDFYQRFLVPDASSKQLIFASRVCTALLMLVSWGVTTQIQTLTSAFSFMIEAGAGLGAVLILRWYWWRINAWSEISATLAPLFFYAISKFYFGWKFPNSFFFTLGFTTFVWLLVTYLTPPTDRKQLELFYKRVRPEGFWGDFEINYRKKFGEDDTKIRPRNRLLYVFLATISATMLAYSLLFFFGKILFGEYITALYCALWACMNLFLLNFGAKKAKIW